MPRSIYLINPSEPYPAYDGTDVLQAWGISDRIGLADLTTPTVAALVPASWTVSLCDERIEPVDLETTAEVIGITGKVSQRRRVNELAAEFRRRGKLVLIGGPHATLDPEDMRGHADILVRGEIEEIAGQLFSDIESGGWRTEYEGGKPDLSKSPVPRWDLTKKGASFWGQVQTSRGCPFECEFCDVIQYLGRKQRWKEPEQIIQELDVLYARGFRRVFFADDNFTVMRRRTRALLEAVREWNSGRPAGPVAFGTQVSVDIARDAEILGLCREAGFRGVFIGIETSNEESLAETKKRQNLRVDLAQEVRKVVEAGMLVTCGMIVGFDHDDVGIFERQAEFISRLPAPMVRLNVLTAPSATPLYKRLAAEGRLQGDRRDGSASLLHTNVRPKLMTQEQLKAGAKWLVNNVFAPSAFVHRLEAFAEICDTGDTAPRNAPVKALHRALATRLATYGEEERAMLARMDRIRERRPELAEHVVGCLTFYCQTRYMFEASGVWDPSLAQITSPIAA